MSLIDVGASITVVTDSRLNMSWAVDIGIRTISLTMNELDIRNAGDRRFRFIILSVSPSFTL